MKVHEVMARSVTSAAPQTSIMEAAAQMRDNDFGFLPVVADGTVVGTLTDRDIVINAVAQGADPTSTNVENAMNDTVVCVSPNDEVHVATQLMEERQIRRLIVVDDDQRLIGTLTLGDIATTQRTEPNVAGVLAEVSRGR